MCLCLIVCNARIITSSQEKDPILSSTRLPLQTGQKCSSYVCDLLQQHLPDFSLRLCGQSQTPASCGLCGVFAARKLRRRAPGMTIRLQTLCRMSLWALMLQLLALWVRR